MFAKTNRISTVYDGFIEANTEIHPFQNVYCYAMFCNPTAETWIWQKRKFALVSVCGWDSMFFKKLFKSML